MDRRVRRVDLTTEELAAADAVVLLTDHETFDMDMVTANARYVLDCRNVLQRGPSVETL